MTNTPYVPLPLGFMDWVAVATDGPYIVAISWPRGETCPTAEAHAAKLKVARARLASVAHSEPDMDGVTVRVGSEGDWRWVAMFSRDRPDWLPYGVNDYTH